MIQGTWYNAKATSTRPLQLKTNGFDLITSLEGGYPFNFSHSVAIEPQAQLVYQNVGLDNARDTSAKVHFHNTNFTAARIGARFTKGWIIGKRENGSVPRLTTWLRPSLWREFQGNALTSFSSETGFIPFTSNLGGNWAEITGGVTADIKQNTRFYASLGYDIGFMDNNKNHAYNGKIGFKTAW